MIQTDQSIPNQILQKVSQAAQEVLGDKLDKVILYGSYARGDYDRESDIDIMVLAHIPQEDAWENNKKINSLLNCIDLEYDLLVSLKVTATDTFQKYATHLPFYMNVIKDGVVYNV